MTEAPAATRRTPSRSVRPAPTPGRRGRAGVAALWELEKLAARHRVRLLLLVCLAGPFAFAVGSRLTQSRPADTLFGRWIGDSGLAVPLVVLGFAASWGLPILTGLVAGDLFASEDAAGTWSMLLTRSTGRGSLFAGKLLALAAYVVVAVTLLATSSVTAGLVVDGHRPLIGLAGNVLPADHALRLTAVAWASVLPAALGYAALGALLSVLTRNGVVAVASSVLIGLGMQFALLVDGLGPVREGLLGTQLLAWHLLFVDPADGGPVVVAALVGLAYVAVCVGLAWLVFRRRDITGSRG